MSTALSAVQDVYAAFGRGDVPGLLRRLSRDVVWQFVGDRRAAYTGTFKGHGQVGEWFQSVAQLDAIEAFEPREFFVGTGHVTVLGWERTRALPDGGRFESEWAHVWQVADGLITRFWGILDTEAAASARR
jgi:uncharacterized protein